MRGGTSRVAMVIALAAVLVASGCIGSDEEADADLGATSTDAADGVANETANATEPVIELVEEVRGFEWDGYIGSELTICGPVGCQSFVYSPLRTAENLEEFPTEPRPVSAWFKLEWDNPHADVVEMVLAIGKYNEAEEGCCGTFAWVQGTSGVTLSVDEIDVTKDETLVLFVVHPQVYNSDVRVRTGGPVDFTVTGEYTVLVPSE